MDPVSLLFTAYLDSIQNTVHARFTDRHGTEIKAVMIDCQRVEVPYQYQLWRVRDKSVCQPYKSQITQFSKCTLAAKATRGPRPQASTVRPAPSRLPLDASRCQGKGRESKCAYKLVRKNPNVLHPKFHRIQN